ncbi:MAG: DUF5115 domain-containing protein [Bacteroides sp.]|nr:DUF5115 domain-containing protein [Bacteroides sp.]
MKKSVLFSIFALGLGLASCDNDFDFPNPPGQSNPQETIFDASSLELTSLVSGTVNLDEINNANALVEIAEIKAVENLPENYNLSFIGQMAADNSFNAPAEFSTTVTDNKIYANPDDLDAAFHKIFTTLDPAAKTVDIHFKAYAVNGASTVRLGGADVYYCPMTASIKPFAPDFTVEEEYYIIGTCTNGSIDASKAIKMTNSGASPYDDPVFSVVVDITSDEAAGGYNWAVVPRSTLSAGKGTVLAPSDPELASDFEGYLVNRDASEGIFGVINASNKHLITVNVRPDSDDLYSYSVQLAIPNLWTPGPANGWNQGASQLLYTNDYKNYEGYVHIDGEFKFTSAPDWDHTNFGFASAGKLSTDPGAGNLKVTQNDEALGNGLYWCTADIVGLTYTATAINTIGIIGDGTPGGWDNETVMTPSADFLTWTVKTTLKEGTFKFRANNGWDINLGGSLDDLTPGADNIPVPETGEVTITLNLSSLPYTATVVK